MLKSYKNGKKLTKKEVFARNKNIFTLHFLWKNWKREQNSSNLVPLESNGTKFVPEKIKSSKKQKAIYK